MSLATTEALKRKLFHRAWLSISRVKYPFKTWLVRTSYGHSVYPTRPLSTSAPKSAGLRICSYWVPELIENQRIEALELFPAQQVTSPTPSACFSVVPWCSPQERSSSSNWRMSWFSTFFLPENQLVLQSLLSLGLEAGRARRLGRSRGMFFLLGYRCVLASAQACILEQGNAQLPMFWHLGLSPLTDLPNHFLLATVCSGFYNLSVVTPNKTLLGSEPMMS